MIGFQEIDEMFDVETISSPLQKALKDIVGEVFIVSEAKKFLCLKQRKIRLHFGNRL